MGEQGEGEREGELNNHQHQIPLFDPLRSYLRLFTYTTLMLAIISH